jgi:hypothetical protein
MGRSDERHEKSYLWKGETVSWGRFGYAATVQKCGPLQPTVQNSVQRLNDMVILSNNCIHGEVRMP